MSFKEIDLKDQSGAQVIEIPDTFKIDDNKAYLKKVGNSIYVIPCHNPWESLIDSIHEFTDDYMGPTGINPLNKRESRWTDELYPGYKYLYICYQEKTFISI